MSKRLGYRDAAQLLGGTDSKIVTALDRATAGLLLGAAVTAPALLAWLDARAEFAKLCQDLVRSVSERRIGLKRWDRTQRLEAAHGILVIAAYFDALATSDLPFNFRDLELTKAEEVALAVDEPPMPNAMTALVDAILVSSQPWLPQPYQPFEEHLKSLENDYYSELTRLTGHFIEGLAIREGFNHADRAAFDRVIREAPSRACSIYIEQFRRLVAEFPELGCWASMHEHRSTRGEIRQLNIALSNLEKTLSGISSGSEPEDQRASLALAYHAELDKPIVEAGDLPEGMKVPKLGEAYVSTRFRVRELSFGASASNETSWQQLPMRHDLEDFLVGHLTSSKATRAPLLILGQPGSGKSVFTRVLAARLPAADFMPIRVALRDVSAAAEPQDQIEAGIRIATGDRREWPDVSRAAGDALPIVLLDGFDELLQATGVSQTDYLAKVAKFQSREADQNRPVAVIVTTRTSVADWSLPPQETIALRLEPFDKEQISLWLSIWNRVNASYLSEQGLQNLTPETVLAHQELAEQPLLLLMLALYDADGNALQHLQHDLQKGELYERLLGAFARREVTKHYSSYPPREVDVAVEEEMRRLSIVAFAMFSRGTQWVSDSDLDDDMTALLGSDPPPRDLRAALSPAEVVLGRFFFVHKSEASQDGRKRRSYEFLHATFGEFLVARFTIQILRNIVSREIAPQLLVIPAPIDDDLLYTVLSFSALSTRAPIIGFLSESRLWVDDPNIEATRDTLIRLFRCSDTARGARKYDRYRPRNISTTGRHARYTANLLLLAACSAEKTSGSALFGDDIDVVSMWTRQTLLWRSQLETDEWRSLSDCLELDRRWKRAGDVTSERDVEIALGVSNVFPSIEPYSLFSHELDIDTDEISISGYSSETLAYRSYFQCALEDDVIFHAIEPVIRLLPGSLDTFVRTSRETREYWSPLRALVEAWLLPSSLADSDEHLDIYQRCFSTAIFRPIRSQAVNDQWLKYVCLLIDMLSIDRVVRPKDVSFLLRQTLDEFEVSFPEQIYVGQLLSHTLRCAMAFLGHDRSVDADLALIVRDCIEPDLRSVGAALALEAWILLGEVGQPLPNLLLTHPARSLETAISTLGKHRPDLERRAQKLLSSNPLWSSSR